MAIAASLVVAVTAATAAAEAGFRRLRGAVADVRKTAAGSFGKDTVLGGIATKLLAFEAVRQISRGLQEFTRSMAAARIAGEGWIASFGTGLDKLIEKGGLLGDVFGFFRYFNPFRPFDPGTLGGDIASAITGKPARGAGGGGKFRQATPLTTGAGADHAAKQTTLLQQIANNTRTARAT
jgi:hypothetical protein